MPGSPKPMVPAEVCGTCAHYHQHYVLSPAGNWMPLWYGHCARPRLKNRVPDETCENWQERKE